jgi:pimeloyl-ACP methyl ester carboxylesterase
MTTSHSDFVALNGTDFYYEVAGSGSPLVLIHAGICDSRMWDAQFADFAKHFQVIRYDMRGYGQTDPVDVPYAHHADLHALLDHIGVGQVHLIGCSMGGGVALDFALMYPDRVLSLTTVCSEPGGFADLDENGEEIEEAVPEHWDQIIEAFKLGAYESVAEWEVHFWVDGPERTAEQVDTAIRRKVYDMNLIALRNEAKEFGENEPLDPPAADRLGELQVPVLIIIGALDQPVMMRAANYMATHINGAQQVVIPNTAHLPSMEQPTQFHQIVLDFLATAMGERR